jgi:hypothetical protein
MTSHGMCKLGHLTCTNSIPLPVHADSCHMQVWSLMTHPYFLISILHPTFIFLIPFMHLPLSPLFLVFLATPFIYQHYKHFHTLYFFPSFLHLTYSMTIQVNNGLISQSKTNHALLMCAVVAANQH